MPEIEVLHVITGLEAGGAERQLALLCLNSDRAEIRHRVLSLTGRGFWGERLEQAGIGVRCLDLPRGRLRPFAVIKLAAIIRRARPDIVQSWLYHADLIATFSSRLANSRQLIWTIRCSDVRFDRYPASLGRVVRLLAWLSRMPSAVATNSEAGERAHRALGYRPRRWSVIPNAVDTDSFRPDPEARSSVRDEFGLPPDSFLIGNFSRHDPMKDHSTCLAAFGRILGPSVLLLAGEGTGPDNSILADQIAKAGIEPDRILRLGPRGDLPRLTAALDVALLTSAYGEGFPNVLVEAMACGIPVVATDSGDASILLEGVAEILPPGDVEAIAGALGRLIATPAGDRGEIGARLRERAQRYSIATMVESYRDLYRATLAARTRPG